VFLLLLVIAVMENVQC